MKRFSLLQVVVLALLTVLVVSCGVPMGTTGDYYEDAPTRRNVYYSDPYLGGGHTIIVERDPFTGRYYQVNPGYYGGGVYGSPVYPRGNRVYNNRTRTYNNRNYNNNRSSTNNGRNNGYYRTYPQTQQRQQPVQSQPSQQQRREAKDAILGRPRN
jgi:hypothetical protein